MHRAKDVYRASRCHADIVKPSPVVFEAPRMTSATFLALETIVRRKRKVVTLAPVWVKK